MSLYLQAAIHPMPRNLPICIRLDTPDPLPTWQRQSVHLLEGVGLGCYHHTLCGTAEAAKRSAGSTVQTRLFAMLLLIDYPLLAFKDLSIEMKRIRFCCVVSGVLLLLVVAMAYKFLWQGDVTPASDGRSAILMPAPERDLVLKEMRGFLLAVQTILTAANAEDAAAIAQAARSVGRAASEGMPGTLVGRLPGSFKKLGFDTHSRFDQLALDAEQLGDTQHSLQQLSELMSNCVACHASYRIDLLQK